jgi:hypothetical protein
MITGLGGLGATWGGLGLLGAGRGYWVRNVWSVPASCTYLWHAK